jgi:hypothetical protein
VYVDVSQVRNIPEDISEHTTEEKWGKVKVAVKTCLVKRVIKYSI